MVDDNRAIFMFKDGSQAWGAKDYLVEQDRCLSVSIENKVYSGKGETNQVKDVNAKISIINKSFYCVFYRRKMMSH